MQPGGDTTCTLLYASYTIRNLQLGHAILLYLAFLLAFSFFLLEFDPGYSCCWLEELDLVRVLVSAGLMGQLAILLNGICFNVALLLINYDFFLINFQCQGGTLIF